MANPGSLQSANRLYPLTSSILSLEENAAFVVVGAIRILQNRKLRRREIVTGIIRWLESHNDSSFQLFGKRIKTPQEAGKSWPPSGPQGLSTDSPCLVLPSSLMTGEWVFPPLHEMTQNPQLVLTILLALCCLFLLHQSHWGIYHHTEQLPVNKYCKENRSREPQGSKPV